MSVRAKKHLGQHFLNDDNIAKNIVESLSTTGYENIIEVGPGTGVLTKYLISKNYPLFLAEIDGESIVYLIENYPVINENNFIGDFLKTDFNFNNEEQIAVIGNFPYNISSQILFKIIDYYGNVPEMVGMFQKEVAERAASKEGNKVYGVLSVLLQYYYQVEYLFSVGNESFTPQPKVQSGVIRLTERKNYLPVKSERAFWVLVKTAFNQRRKTLRNGVKSLIPKEILEDKFFDRRAETLSVEEFAALTFKMI